MKIMTTIKIPKINFKWNLTEQINFYKKIMITLIIKKMLEKILIIKKF